MGEGKDSENVLAVAILAAAAIGAKIAPDMAAAVAQAKRALAGGVSATASQIADSVRGDKIMCLEDGTWHVMLRRYLARKYGMTPAQYRTKWGLPDDYPFVAPDYANRRSGIAKSTGLGRK